MLAGNIQHVGAIFHVDADAQHVLNAVLTGVLQRTFQLAVEGFEIETIKMTVGVDQVHKSLKFQVNLDEYDTTEQTRVTSSHAE